MIQHVYNVDENSSYLYRTTSRVNFNAILKRFRLQGNTADFEKDKLIKLEFKK